MARKAIPAELDRRVRQQARNRCSYCLSSQHLVMARIEVRRYWVLAGWHPPAE